MENANTSLSRPAAFFNALLENSYDIIIMTDDQLKIAYCSKSLERITGWKNTTLDQPIIFELVHSSDRDKLKGIIKTALTQTGKRFKVTFRTRHKKRH